MDIRFELGSSAQPKGTGDKLILHVRSDHGSDDTGRHFDWPEYGEVSDAWVEAGAKLGEAKLIDVAPKTRIAVVIGQTYEWPNYVSDPKAIAKGIAAVAKQVKPPTSVHVTRFGGAVWSTVENALHKGFLARGIPVTIYDDYIRAIEDGDLDAVKSLIANGKSVTKQTEGGHYPLTWAVYSVYNGKDAEPIVRYLLETGIKHPPDLLEAALVAHRSKGKLDWLVEQLLEKATARNLPPAILNNTTHVPYAKRLIELGASVTAKDSGGATPLHLAARFGDEELMRLLIERGAKLTAKDGDKMTPLDYAKDYQRKNNVALLKKWMAIPPRSKEQVARDLEAQLVDDVRKSVAKFAAKHKSELFYGFVLDCNAEEGDALFCLDPTTDADKQPKDREWNPGDWKYQGFQERRLDLDGLAAPAFLELACRALTRLEREDGFAPLRKTASFTTLVVDHDEPLANAWRRMDKVRNASSGPAGKKSRR